MSGAKETALWDWQKKAKAFFKHDLHMNRVENSTMAGMPDVEGYLRTCMRHGQFWTELKSTARPARETTPIRFAVRDRQAQIEWIEKRWGLGGAVSLLLQVGVSSHLVRYLVPGMHVRQVYEGVPESRLRELAAVYGGPRDLKPQQAVMAALAIRD